MPKMTVSKESLKGSPPCPPGIYEFRCDGFSPKKSKNGQSVNLNPKMVVINHPTLNDRRLFENLNSNAGWIQLDFVHSLGIPMADYGAEAGIPGDFIGPDDDPEKWTYAGPVSGRVGKLEYAETDNGRGGTKMAIKRFFCTVPGCTEKHSENLL